MTNYILGTIGAGIFVGCAVSVIRQALFVFQMLKATRHAPSTNDDHLAVDSFTTLLGQADANMTVYDDGNQMDGSLYMDEEVVEAVKKKLHNVPAFRMFCYFNYNEPDTLFRQAFDNHDQVEIRTRPDGHDRPDDTHYKIIDDGRMAYLSQHSHGATDRKFQMVDCTGVKESMFEDVTDSLLGAYKRDIAQKFPSAPPAS